MGRVYHMVSNKHGARRGHQSKQTLVARVWELVNANHFAPHISYIAFDDSCFGFAFLLYTNYRCGVVAGRLLARRRITSRRPSREVNMVIIGLPSLGFGAGLWRQFIRLVPIPQWP